MPSARPSGFALTSPGALRLYSTEELLCLPPPEWLVEGIVPTSGSGSCNVIYGPSGCGKTFTAIDLAVCVGSGMDWHGHEIKDRHLVAYVSAEGTGGMGPRAFAALGHYGLEPRDVNIVWLMEGISIYSSSEEVDQLLERFEELAKHKKEQPALVVIDTLARCFEGDENETQDMSDFVKGIDRIRNDCGSAVLVVHHTNSAESRERGSGVLRAASDMMMLVTPGALGQSRAAAQGFFTLSCTKQKEAVPFAPGTGQLIPVDGTTSVGVKIRW